MYEKYRDLDTRQENMWWKTVSGYLMSQELKCATWDYNISNIYDMI